MNTEQELKVSTSTSGATVLLGTTSAAPNVEAATIDPGVKPSASPKAIESAVYGYIRSVRALGQTEVNTATIARALGITEREVFTTLEALRRKGVKIVP